MNLSNFQVARKLSSSLSLFPKESYLKFKIGFQGFLIRVGDSTGKYGVMEVFRAKKFTYQ